MPENDLGFLFRVAILYIIVSKVASIEYSYILGLGSTRNMIT